MAEWPTPDATEPSVASLNERRVSLRTIHRTDSGISISFDQIVPIKTRFPDDQITYGKPQESLRYAIRFFHS